MLNRTLKVGILHQKRLGQNRRKIVLMQKFDFPAESYRIMLN